MNQESLGYLGYQRDSSSHIHDMGMVDTSDLSFTTPHLHTSLQHRSDYDTASYVTSLPRTTRRAPMGRKHPQHSSRHPHHFKNSTWPDRAIAPSESSSPNESSPLLTQITFLELSVFRCASSESLIAIVRRPQPTSAGLAVAVGAKPMWRWEANGGRTGALIGRSAQTFRARVWPNLATPSCTPHAHSGSDCAPSAFRVIPGFIPDCFFQRAGGSGELSSGHRK